MVLKASVAKENAAVCFDRAHTVRAYTQDMDQLQPTVYFCLQSLSPSFIYMTLYARYAIPRIVKISLCYTAGKTSNETNAWRTFHDSFSLTDPEYS